MCEQGITMATTYYVRALQEPEWRQVSAEEFREILLYVASDPPLAEAMHVRLARVGGDESDSLPTYSPLVV